MDDMDIDFEIDSETPPKTPPGSPIIGYAALRPSTGFNSDEYCFECKGPIRPSDVNFSPNGLIAKGDLIASLKLLNRSLEDSIDDSEWSSVRYKFFNFPFEPTEQKLDIFIKICRKNVSMLENSVQHSLDAFSKFDLRHSEEESSPALGLQSSWELRRDVCNFLNFVLKNAQVFKGPETDFMQVFRGLQRSLLRTEAWPASLKNHGGSHDGNKCTSPCYHFFHLHLELRWFFTVLSNVSPVVVEWVLEDLIHLAWFKFTTDKMNEWSSKSVSKVVAFNCYCVKELWTMILHVVDEVKPHGKDFWDLITTSINGFDKKGDDFLFPLWLIANLAPLKNYSFKGKYSENPCSEQGSDCYHFVREIVKDLVSKNQKMTDVMDILHSLLPFWGSDVGIVQILWSFWSTKINRTSGFVDYNYWKSPEKWVALIKSLVPPDTGTSCGDQSSSVANDEIFPFIRLFCGQICHFPKDKKIQKLTNIIYLKLPESKAVSFGELGLIRLSTVHLATIYAASNEEAEAVCKSFMDSFHTIYEELTKQNKQSSVRTVLTAQVTAFLLLLDKGISVSSVVSPVMQQVSALMLRDSKVVIDPKKRELIMVYLEFLDSVPKFGSQVDLGQADLFSTHFPIWLNSAAPDYLNRAFRVFHNILSWLLKDNRLPELVHKIYDCSKDILKKLVYSKSPKTTVQSDLEPLVDLAADFTYLHRHSATVRDNYFDTLALDVKINVEISRLYVEKILDFQPAVIEDPLKLLQAWVRLCCLDVEVPTNLISSVMDNMNSQYLPGYSNEALLSDFCQYAKTEWERSDLENILQPLTEMCRHNWTPYKDNLRCIESIVKSTCVIISSLEFSEKIYVARIPCVAKTILDFYSNLWVNLTEELGPLWSEYLPKIFDSITSFDAYERDPYLLRQVQTIVTTSFVGFARNEFLRSYETHPCVKIMQSAVELDRTPVLEYLGQIKLTPTEQAHFLKTLSIFTKRSLNLAPAVLYALPTLLRIVRTTAGQEVQSCVEIICSLLDPNLTNNMSPAVLERMMKDAFEKEFGPNLSLNYRKYFKLLQSMATFKCAHRTHVRKFLTEQLVPLLREQIKLCQLQRGTGQNASLWNALDLLELELNRSF